MRTVNSARLVLALGMTDAPEVGVVTGVIGAEVPMINFKFFFGTSKVLKFSI